MNKHLQIKRIIDILTSVLIALAGLSLAIACIHIYKSAPDTPFSQEAVKAHLLYVSPICILALISIITGFVFHISYPEEQKKLKGDTNEFITLKKLTASLIKKNPSAQNLSSIKKEQKNRRIIRIVYFSICTLTIIIALIIALDFDRYTTETINRDITLCAVTVIALSIIALSLGYIADRMLRKSAKNECEIIKSELASPSIADEANTPDSCKKERKFKRLFAKINKKAILNVLKTTILIASIIFVIIGITNGGMADVLGKAVKICTECIGLG